MNSFFKYICCIKENETDNEEESEIKNIELSYISLLIPFDIIDDIENTEKEIDELNKISNIFWSVYNGN